MLCKADGWCREPMYAIVSTKDLRDLSATADTKSDDTPKRSETPVADKAEPKPAVIISQAAKQPTKTWQLTLRDSQAVKKQLAAKRKQRDLERRSARHAEELKSQAFRPLPKKEENPVDKLVFVKPKDRKTYHILTRIGLPSKRTVLSMIRIKDPVPDNHKATLAMKTPDGKLLKVVAIIDPNISRRNVEAIGPKKHLT